MRFSGDPVEPEPAHQLIFDVLAGSGALLADWSCPQLKNRHLKGRRSRSDWGTGAVADAGLGRDGRRSARIEGIRLDGKVASATVQTGPAQVELIGGLAFTTTRGCPTQFVFDGAVIRFTLASVGGITATGVRAVLRDVTVSGDRTQNLVLPAMDVTHRLHGEIRDEPEVWRGEITLQFHDQAADVIAQTVSGAGRRYSIDLTSGHYRVRAGLASPVGGFLRTYEVGTVPIEGDLQWDIELESTATAVATDPAPRATDSALEQNFPYPLNPSTVIRYQLSASARVELAIYNLLGQRVVTLVDAAREAGTHVARLDGRDDSGRDHGSGVYLCRLRVANHVQTRRLVMLR